jgi:hypothetical protein
VPVAGQAERLDCLDEDMEEVRTFRLGVAKARCPSCGKPAKLHSNYPGVTWNNTEECLEMLCRCSACLSRVVMRQEIRISATPGVSWAKLRGIVPR